MKPVTCVRFEKAEFDLITEALLAARVGDEDRDIRALKSLVGDNSPISRERLDRAADLLTEIIAAVEQEIVVASAVADPFAEPTSEAHMGHVIVEARRKMRRDLGECDKMIAQAQKMAASPVTDRDRGVGVNGI